MADRRRMVELREVIFNKLVDSNLSNVSTDAKANTEFILSYRKDNHICVYSSD